MMKLSQELPGRLLGSVCLFLGALLGCAHPATEACVAAPQPPPATVPAPQRAPVVAAVPGAPPAAVSLASWRKGAAKQRILSFVKDVSDAGGAH
jgi:hypothetical protein